MIRRVLILVALGVSALAGCGEGEQTTTGVRTDKHAFAGTNKKPPYMTDGWKAGDKAAWEAQLKVRTVNGQNDYAKVP